MSKGYQKILDMLDEIQVEDAGIAGDLCRECHKKRKLWRTPRWHIYGRMLCQDCGHEYEKFLFDIGSWDKDMARFM